MVIWLNEDFQIKKKHFIWKSNNKKNFKDFRILSKKEKQKNQNTE